MSERGMKKWAPYKSLTEQTTSLLLLHKKRNRMERPLISSDEAELINEVLVNYNNECVALGYYDDGNVFEIITKLIKIDAYNKSVTTDKRKVVEFRNIISLRLL